MHMAVTQQKQKMALSKCNNLIYRLAKSVLTSFLVSVNGIFDASHSMRVLIKGKAIHWVVNCPDSNKNLACPRRKKAGSWWSTILFPDTSHPLTLSQQSANTYLWPGKPMHAKVWYWKDNHQISQILFSRQSRIPLESVQFMTQWIAYRLLIMILQEFLFLEHTVYPLARCVCGLSGSVFMDGADGILSFHHENRPWEIRRKGSHAQACRGVTQKVEMKLIICKEACKL